MIDEKSFEEKLWKLNESGDFPTTLNLVNIILEMGYVDRSGMAVGFDYLVKKYKDYMAWWDNRFGDKDPRFIRNSDNLKSIYDFLGDNMYQSEWKSPPKIRDAYLFGNKSLEELKDSLARFRESLNGS